MTDQQLAAIKERAEKATPGPWFHGQNADGQHNVYAGGGIDITPAWCVHGLPMCPDDAAFIAYARTDVPALVAEVERLSHLETRRIDRLP